jgi:hypothetical protein
MLLRGYQMCLRRGASFWEIVKVMAWDGCQY